MYLFIKKRISSGIVNAVKRDANNKYIKDYNADEKSKYLMYLDANNLYKQAVIQKLPYNELKFEDNISINDISVEILKKYTTNLNKIGKGCILKVPTKTNQNEV